MSISAKDVEAVLGRVDDLLLGEVIRTGATAWELRRAVRMVRSRAPDSLAVSDALPARMQRLVDLCAVAAGAGPERPLGAGVRSHAA
jgi:hypothetical protein